MQLMGIEAYKDWNLNTSDVYVKDNANRYWQRDVTLGEIGCTLSHIAIWEDAYKNGYDNILVYEDDFVFEKPMDWSQLDKVKSMNYDFFI
jgi:GR25 family glycosyltransferase involved in LPS biosynthesis